LCAVKKPAGLRGERLRHKKSPVPQGTGLLNREPKFN